MAVLNDTQRDEIAVDFMKRLSDTRTGTGILSPADMRSIVNAMDDALDSAESATVTAFVPNSDIRDWLIANASVSRRGLSQVEDYRRDNL